MMIEVESQIALVGITPSWKRVFESAFTRYGIETLSIDAALALFNPNSTKGRLHIVGVPSPRSQSMRLVRLINELEGRSLVIPGRGFGDEIAQGCLDLKGAYTLPHHMRYDPKLIAQTAILTMWGK